MANRNSERRIISFEIDLNTIPREEPECKAIIPIDEPVPLAIIPPYNHAAMDALILLSPFTPSLSSWKELRRRAPSSLYW